MIHQPAGGFEGQASDIEIQAKEIIKVKHRLNEIYARHTGQDVKKVEKDVDRDYFMSPKEAMEYGLIDKVIERSK
jgi:ATP-dependent Clp protease protease subunit